MKTILTICMIFSFGVSQAQDVFQESLYSAETVMKNRDKIALTDQQAEKIKKIHSQNAGEFSTIKWDLDAATAKLKTLLDEPKVNQEAVQKQMDLVLQLENQLKKKQLTTLVAIKNELTLTQQKELNQLKSVKNSQNSVFGSVAPIAIAGDKGRVTIASENAEQPLFFLEENGKMKKISNLESYNPDDIESITVIKDQTAVARFGNEGKNGVIIIKLKKK
ncbi:hypothetical protein [Mariniradius sediminis]|uniref:TonB-dependent outer membrane receptor, SusC/RagA subfamily, signature region n=1 Tax=Mariniradius sediminis TaxID=2909237 RepID=A0ABS9BP10_9BACT|nr:hypothetical protein [Mariniradius sediminis]MCF1749801.1 hypothetical protein [Mariniradius sediminis]